MTTSAPPPKIFIDTNVLIDVLARRAEFYEDSAAIWSLSEQGRLTGVIASISVTNIYYIVRKLTDHKIAMKSMVQLRDIFSFAICDHQVISQAIDAKPTDFEDAVQYFSALHAGVAAIVTRDPKHFPRGNLPIVTPREFLAGWQADRDAEADKKKANTREEAVSRTSNRR